MKDKVTLYIASHNKTGKKYFGKTSKYFTEEELQKKYHGSGSYWVRHLNKHGNDVSIHLYGIYDKSEVANVAMKFSIENNIVESKEWANLKPENGLDGWSSGVKLSEKVKLRLSAANKDKVTIIKDGINIKISKDEFRNNRENYVHINENKLQVIDIKTNKRLSINKDSFNNGIHKHYSKNKVSCIVDGVNKLVDIEEFKKHKYQTSTSNKVTVKNKEGKTQLINKSDERFLSGELVGAMKDTITVKDSNGKKLRVNKTDERYLSGELIGVSAGLIWINNGIERKTIRPELLKAFSDNGWVRGKKLRVNS